MSRTLGSSISFCLVTCIATLASQNEGDVANGFEWSYLVVSFLFFLCVFVAALRIGNFRYERGKWGFRENNVREVDQSVVESERKRLLGGDVEEALLMQ